MPKPPTGRWTVDRAASQRRIVQFDHIGAGKVDWVADVMWSSEWAVGTKAARGWTYIGGGPAPFPDVQQLHTCADFVPR